MMKRIVATLFFLLLFLAAAALIAPGFIDWSQHKDRLIAQMEPYLGRKIAVGGQVKFRLIPNPQILLEDVTLGNAPGAKADSFMKLKQLEARMKFAPLLQGRFEVDTINLADPELNLEILDDGSANWNGILKEREQSAGGIGAEAVQLNQVTMTNGTLHYRNNVSGATWQVDNLNLSVSAETLFGPYRISGDMLYRDTQVAVEASTGKFGGTSAVPLHIAFNPVKNLPVVKLEGTLDTQSGLNLQGDLAISQGNLASLFDNDFLKGIGFMEEETDLSGTLSAQGGEVKLTDIKAKFGKKGEISGVVSIAFEKGKKPAATANLSGSNLKLTGKPEFLSVPGAFDAHVKLKGRALSWNGHYFPGASLSADTDKEEWVVKNLRLDLAGKSVVKMAGVVTPKKKYAGYSIQITTDDLGQMLKSARMTSDNAFKILEDSGVVKKLDFASTMDLTPDKISFSNIDARVGDSMKVSGVLNVRRDAKAPSWDGSLNFDGTDVSAIAPEAWKSFVNGVMKSEAEVDVTAKNFSHGDIKVADFQFKGKIGADGLAISQMTGHLTPQESFSLGGKVASFEPVAGMDLAWSLQAAQLGGAAQALGVEIPPPLRGSSAADIKGQLGGDAQKYTFTVDGTVQGGEASLSGSAEQSDSLVYHETLRLKNGGWAQLGLPIDKLVGSDGHFEFSGDLSGTRASYKIDKVVAGNVSGWIGRKDGKATGALTVGTLDFDAWLWNGWNVKDDLTIDLKAETLLWRGDEVANPELHLEAGADRVKVSGLKGHIWGGDLTADVDAHKKADAWTGMLKGDAKSVDLDELAKLMEFRGFTVGTGDLGFDVTSDSKKQEKDWFHGIEGALTVTADSLSVKNFNPAAVAKLIAPIDAADESLAQKVLKALNSGATTYSNVEGAFKIGNGKINIEKMKLADDDAAVKVKGAFDLGPGTFHVTGDVKLKSPADAPSFAVSRSGEMKGAPDYTASIQPLAEYLARRVPKEQPKPPVEVSKPAAEAIPPHPQPEELLPEETNTTPPAPQPETGGADGGDGNALNAPIDTEPLEAPAMPPQPVSPSPPEQPSAAPPDEQSGNGGAIKGILDRLDDAPQGAPDKKDEEKPAPDAGTELQQLGPPPDDVPAQTAPEE